MGKTVTVHKHYERVEIHHRGAVVASHQRVIGERDVRRTLPGHHTVPKRAPRELALAEQLLRGEPEVLQRYATKLKLHHQHGRGVRALHRLVQIKRTYPREPFLAAVAQALKFGLFDLTRLEHLVLRHVAATSSHWAMSMTMTTREQLHALLSELNLKGIARALDAELDRAQAQAEPAAEVLHRLLTEQASFQRQRRLVYRVAQARLPWPWTLDTFPFAKQPGVDRAQVRALAGLDFVRRAQNLVLIGPTGTGKTGIAIGLLRQACLNGYTFYNAQALFDELYASLADRTTTKLLKAMSRMRPIVIDELGYPTLKPEQVNTFFRLMEQRYGRVSSIITTNLDYPAWYDMFGDKPLVDALLDRLRHQCITVRINGPSLREPLPSHEAGSPPAITASSPSGAQRAKRGLARPPDPHRLHRRPSPQPSCAPTPALTNGQRLPKPTVRATGRARPGHKRLRTRWVRFW